MNVVELILSALLNILSVQIDFRIISFFLEKKERKKSFTNVIYGLTWILNWGVYVLYKNLYLTSISLVLLLLFATFILFQGTLIRKVVAVFSSMALGIAVDDIIWRICSCFNLIERIELFANLITSLILILLILILEQLFRVDKKNYITRESYVHITLVLFGNILLIYILSGIATVDRFEILFVLIILCLIDISTFWLHNKVNEVYHEKLEQQMMKEQVFMYKKQFQIIQQSQQKIDSLQHDIKKHLYLVNSYLEKEDYQAAKKYIQRIEDYIVVSGQYVNTGNQELDAILNYSLERAERMKCKVETKLMVPDGSFMQEFDLNTLLGNLLDNALEALEKVQERYLYIGISFRNGMLLIRIWNSFDGMINKRGDLYQSRKKEREKHGIGLQNIKEIVHKYDGIMKLNVTKDLFKIDIILHLP